MKDAVFPRRCIACKKLFLRSEHGDEDDIEEEDSRGVYKNVMSPFLCTDCLPGFVPVESPICPRCGMMFHERNSDDHFCGRCIKSSGEFRVARAVGVYDQSLMSVVRSYKYNGKTQLAKPLGRLLFFLFQDMYLNSQNSPPDLIIPVPLHKKRFRQRGFNQSWLILRKWPDISKIKATGKGIQLRRDVLVRKKWTESQAGLDQKKRKSNIKGAFSLLPYAEIKGKKILLVDDVYTTGATVDECAGVLMKNGAKHVDIITLARTI